MLSRGPNHVARRFSGYVINGYRFHTRKREARLKTQNSGVTLEAMTQNLEKSVTYYGAIKDIIELDYYGHFKYVLFRCDWFVTEKDKYGLTCVYSNKKCEKNDPFVLASQVQQCFFIKDPLKKNRHYVWKALPRDSFDMGESLISDDQQSAISSNFAILDDCEVDLVRKDVPDDILENNLFQLHDQQKENKSDRQKENKSDDEDTDESSYDST